MNLLALLPQIFGPLAQMVDQLYTSDAERLEASRKLLEIQVQATQAALDYQQQITAAQSQIILAEAVGESWLQRNWRPITMLSFLALALADGIGLLAHPLAPEAWQLLQLGIGGYVVGRSVEKIAPVIGDALRNPK